MIVALNIVMISMFAASFCFAVTYFVNLYKFKKIIIIQHPDIWSNQRARSRPLESWVQPTYKILRRVRNGAVDGIALSKSAANQANKTNKLLYSGVICFLLFLFTALSLTFLDPMK